MIGASAAVRKGGIETLDMELIYALAQKAEGRIGIGVRMRSDIIRSSVQAARDQGLPEVDIYERGMDLCTDLQQGKLCAAVRGTLPSTEILSSVQKIFGVPGLLRVALLMTASGKPFFMAPVGIDEGNTLAERFELLRQGVKFLNCLGVKPDIAVLSKGRAEDAIRGEEIRTSLAEGDRLSALARELGLVAHHKYILIEQAVEEADFVIAPDGVSGNLIFRSLYFLGKGEAIGAPVVNVGSILVDTSREKRSYVDSITLAAALCAAVERKRL